MEINQPTLDSRMNKTMPKSTTLQPFDGANLFEKQKSLISPTAGDLESEFKQNVPATLDGSEIGLSQGQSSPIRSEKKVIEPKVLPSNPVKEEVEPEPIVDPTLTLKEIKQQKRLTKVRIQTVFNLLKIIKEDKLGTMDFDWAKNLQGSLLNQQEFVSIIPTLMVLKKFSLTPKANNSLRNVLARKLFDIK